MAAPQLLARMGFRMYVCMRLMAGGLLWVLLVMPAAHAGNALWSRWK